MNSLYEGNGRINLFKNTVGQNSFLMNDKIPVKQTVGYNDALKGDLENTPLSTTYFSINNIQIIQNGIRAEVVEVIT